MKLLRPYRLIKALIWHLRIQRWQRLIEKGVPYERRCRLAWKIQGAEKKMTAYLAKNNLALDLSGG